MPIKPAPYRAFAELSECIVQKAHMFRTVFSKAPAILYVGRFENALLELQLQRDALRSGIGITEGRRVFMDMEIFVVDAHSQLEVGA